MQKRAMGPWLYRARNSNSQYLYCTFDEGGCWLHLDVFSQQIFNLDGFLIEDACRGHLKELLPRCGLVMDVSILLGSKSDMPIADKCTKVLDKFGVKLSIACCFSTSLPKIWSKTSFTRQRRMDARSSSQWQDLQLHYLVLSQP